MNRKVMIAISIISVLVILVIVYTFESQKRTSSNASKETVIQDKVSKQTIVKTLTNSAEASSGLSEKIELHATYYFEEIVQEKNSYVAAGENLLKYTNGTYEVAPYDLVVTGYSLPEEGEQITNSHYIEVKTTETLNMTINISEANMDIAKLGQEVEVVINAFESTPYKGIITSRDETGTYSSGKTTFSAVVTFMNDGNIKLGMSGYCTIILEEAKDVLSVPVEAVEEKDDRKYLTVVNEDGTTKEVEVEIGLSNANFVEIKSGLEEGQMVRYISDATGKTEKTSTASNSNDTDRTAMELMRAFNN